MNPFHRRLLFTLIGLALLSSCVSYQQDSSDALNPTIGIQRGVTTASWIRDHLGAPDSTHTRGNDSEIWHYEFDKEEETSVSVPFLFSFHGREGYNSDFYVELKEGVVQDYWED